MASIAKVTKITATSRVTLKVRDNFYVVEFTEERSLPEVSPDDPIVTDERQLLFDDVNDVVDKQAEEIMQMVKGAKK